jgi:hypothetical protein
VPAALHNSHCCYALSYCFYYGIPALPKTAKLNIGYIMTTLVLVIQRPLLVFHRGFEYLQAIFAGAAEGQEMARRYEQLSRLSDDALAARGLTREQIAYAAMTGRGRR